MKDSDLLEEARASMTLFISVLSVWEVALLVEKKRVKLDRSLDAWLDLSFTLWEIQLMPLTRNIAVEATRLPGELHRDPADRILAATARVEDLTLVTHDRALLAYARQGYLRARKV
jgi:PIN domain nuclease of toxin-antitoxin system